MFDTDADGKVNQVKATFSESLASYTAGNAPWTLANIPSAGSLASVSISSPVATLTITEGAGAADTSVGSFTVALGTSATGIRDSEREPELLRRPGSRATRPARSRSV